MIAGNPERFAILTERTGDRHGDQAAEGIKGILHVCVNGVAYPRKPRTTDLSNDIRCLFDEEISAFACPKVSRGLMKLKGKKLFRRLRTARFPKGYSDDEDCDRRYDLTLEGPSTAGYHLFVLTDGQDIRVLIGRRKRKKHGGRLRYIDDVTVSSDEYQRVVSRMHFFYRSSIDPTVRR